MKNFIVYCQFQIAYLIVWRKSMSFRHTFGITVWFRIFIIMLFETWNMYLSLWCNTYSSQCCLQPEILNHPNTVCSLKNLFISMLFSAWNTYSSQYCLQPEILIHLNAVFSLKYLFITRLFVAWNTYSSQGCL